MHSFVMQDWTTIRFAAAGSIIQEEDHWLDLSAYQDVQFYIQWSNVTAGAGNSLTMAVETSPNKDDALFVAGTVVPGFAINHGTSGVQVKTAIMVNAATPLARFVRWKVTAGAGIAFPADITFRILAVGNSPGR